jgi:hypothetical protein
MAFLSVRDTVESARLTLILFQLFIAIELPLSRPFRERIPHRSSALEASRRVRMAADFFFAGKGGVEEEILCQISKPDER